jgi:hypothetical protein
MSLTDEREPRISRRHIADLVGDAAATVAGIVVMPDAWVWSRIEALADVVHPVSSAAIGTASNNAGVLA